MAILARTKLKDVIKIKFKISWALISKFMAILILFGFQDAKELENRNFILALGLDKINNNIMLTSFCADTMPIDFENKNHVKYQVAENLDQALEKLNNLSGKENYFGHVKIIFLNKNLISQNNKLEEIIYDLEHRSFVNQKTKFFLCTNAKKIILENLNQNLLDFTKNNKNISWINASQIN